MQVNWRIQHNIDAKGRLTMPAKFSPGIRWPPVVTGAWMAACSDTPMENWALQEEELKKLNLMKDARQFARFFSIQLPLTSRVGLISATNASDYAKIDMETCRHGVLYLAAHEKRTKTRCA